MKPRIITGSAKGQKLEVPIKGCRPMMDRVKSAMFSILNPIIPNSHILDLYAGTGSLGIECLSRGAKSATFVDKSKYAVTCIRNNLDKTGFTKLGKALKCSSRRFLEEFKTFDLKVQKFDIIFFTPPYKHFKEKVLEMTYPLMKENSILVAEHSRDRKLKGNRDRLIKIEERSYRNTTLSFYKRGRVE